MTRPLTGAQEAVLNCLSTSEPMLVSWVQTKVGGVRSGILYSLRVLEDRGLAAQVEKGWVRIGPEGPILPTRRELDQQKLDALLADKFEEVRREAALEAYEKAAHECELLAATVDSYRHPYPADGRTIMSETARSLADRIRGLAKKEGM